MRRSLPRPPGRLDAAFGAGWFAVPRLPKALTGRLFDVGAEVAVRRGGFEQLRNNLRQVVGRQMPDDQFEDLIARAVRSYVRYWREVFQLPGWDRDDIVDRHEYGGIDNLQTPIDDGRGVVLALTHSGNWDAASIAVTHGMGVGMTVVAERLQPESLYQRFRAFRESLGMEVAALTGDEVPAVVTMKRRIADNGVVCLLSDRDLAGNGIHVELCGRRTTMPSGPALLALQTGAALIPTQMGFTPGGWSITFHPEVPIPDGKRLRDRVEAATQEVANLFTDFIRAAPQDWHMFQRIWPDV